jgi:hypothetical protein
MNIEGREEGRENVQFSMLNSQFSSEGSGLI